MLDIRLFREQPDYVKAGLEKAGTDPSVVDRVRALDEQVRALKTSSESLKAELNAANKALGPLMKTMEPQARDAKRAELRAVGDRITVQDAERSAAEAELQDLLAGIPNLPHEKVPVGRD